MVKQEQTNPSDSLIITQPLQLYKDRKRRYVRLEIAAPVSYAAINIDRPLQEAQDNQKNGTILNLSGGGALLICPEELAEGTYLMMNLELTGVELLSGIVGKVKRVDEDGEGSYLVGVEFCPEAELNSVFGPNNIGSIISTFDDKVRRFLLRYIFARKVDERMRQNESGLDENEE